MKRGAQHNKIPEGRQSLP